MSVLGSQQKPSIALNLLWGMGRQVAWRYCLMQIAATWVQEKSQMIASASGSPMPNEPPMISASAKSKPSPARNSRHDMPLLLQAHCPRIM
jgi:hypothetical protein